jgi:hypothetical protein
MFGAKTKTQLYRPMEFVAMIAGFEFARDRDSLQHTDSRIGLSKPARRVALVLLSWMLATAAARAEQEGEMRTWTDSTGQSRVEAALVKVEDGKAHFRRKDGRPGSVPLERLSVADRQYIAKWQQPKPAAPPEAVPKVAPRPVAAQPHDAIVVVRYAPPAAKDVTPSGPAAGASPQIDNLPGVLVWTEKNRAYVLSRGVGAFVARDVGARAIASFSVTFGLGTGKPRTVAAKIVGLEGTQGFAVLRIKAEGIPPPIPLDGKVELKNGDKVSVLGCKVLGETGDKAAYNRVALPATVSLVESGFSPGGIGKRQPVLRVLLRGTDGRQLPPGVVVDERNHVLGIVDDVKPGFPTHRTGDDSAVALVPVAEIAALRNPRILNSSLMATKSAPGGIEFQVTSHTEDLFGRASKAYLLLKRLGPKESIQDVEPATMVPTALESAKPTGNSLGPAPPTIPGHRNVTVQWRDAGRWDAGEPLRYAARLKTVDESGTELISEPFGPQADFVGSEKAFTESLLGLSPVTQPHPDGGMQITIRCPDDRASCAKVVDPPKQKWPEPQESKELVASSPSASGAVKTTTAILGLKNARGRIRAPLAVAWTPDGKYAFIVLEDGTIRKVQFPELREVKRLSLPFPSQPEDEERFDLREPGNNSNGCAAMLSAEGLVVLEPPTDEVGAVWVIDPETLRVKRRKRIPIGPAATSPGLSSLFVFVGRPLVVDLATGEIVRGRFPLRGIVGSEHVSASVSTDGKYLFAFSKGRIARIRIEKHDLVVEEISAATGTGQGPPALSRDGKRLTVSCCLTSPANREDPSSKYGVGVFKVSDLKTPLSFVSDRDLNWPEGAEARGLFELDPVSGNWYQSCVIGGASLRGAIQVNSPNGKFVVTLPMAGEVTRMYPYPKGNALLVQLSENLIWMPFSP